MCAPSSASQLQPISYNNSGAVRSIQAGIAGDSEQAAGTGTGEETTVRNPKPWEIVSANSIYPASTLYIFIASKSQEISINHTSWLPSTLSGANVLDRGGKPYSRGKTEELCR